jgi:hypothetical protein
MGADGGADDPVWLYSSLVQGIVDASLIGAERTPALEDEHDPLRRCACHRHERHLGLGIAFSTRWHEIDPV